MENDQAFEADADVDALERLDSRSRQRSSHKGQEALEAAFGRFGSRRDTNQEDTPLLRRDGDQEDEIDGHSEHGESNGRAPPTWDGEGDFEGRPWWNMPSVFWLLPPFALFTMAFGGTIVPRLNLIMDLICREYFTDRSLHDPTFHVMPIMLGDENKQCRTPEVQSLVSKFTLYGTLISGILSAIVSPKLGALSDRYGRLRMVCYTTLGILINELVVICVATYPDILSVNWILAGFMFDGLGGSFIAGMALSYAYASDCTAPERRNVAFGYYHAALFAGIAVGPILAGYIVERTGKILTVFYIALALHTAFLLFLLLVVPESLTKERQLQARQKKDFVDHGEQATQTWPSRFVKILKGGNLPAPLAILWPTGEGTNPAVRRNLVLIASVDTAMFGVAMGSMTVILLYSEYMFGWNTFQTSVFVSVVNTCRVITLLILLPIITRILRGPRSKAVKRNSGSDNIDLGIIRTAILFDVLGYVGYTIVRTGPLFTLCGAAAAVGGMGSPTLQAALTKHVPPDRTGQVLGAMGLLHASARVIAPTIFNLVYASTVGNFTQTVFVCLAATFGVAFGLSWFIRSHVYWDEPHEPHQAPDPANGVGSANDD